MHEVPLQTDATVQQINIHHFAEQHSSSVLYDSMLLHFPHPKSSLPIWVKVQEQHAIKIHFHAAVFIKTISSLLLQFCIIHAKISQS